MYVPFCRCVRLYVCVPVCTCVCVCVCMCVCVCVCYGLGGQEWRLICAPPMIRVIEKELKKTWGREPCFVSAIYCRDPWQSLQGSFDKYMHASMQMCMCVHVYHGVSVCMPCVYSCMGITCPVACAMSVLCVRVLL